MIRTQIYLTEKEKEGLEKMSALKGISQSDLIRLAVDDLLSRTDDSGKSCIVEELAGIWRCRQDIPSVRELRSSWGKRSD